MSDAASLVDRADMLIQRRRFVAKGSSAQQNTLNSPAPDEEEFPVLTEVVAQQIAEEPTPLTFSKEDVEAMAKEIALAVETQVAYELPTLMEATLCKLGEELRAGISATIETAISRHLAQFELENETNNRHETE